MVSTAQLDAAGLGRKGASRRVGAGRLHRVHRGVYAVGQPALSRQGRWLAAVLTCGEGAVLSHRNAAALWGLLESVSGPVHVTVPGDGGRRRRAGITVHRSPALRVADTTRRHGIPVTTPARTVADLRRELPAADVRKALRKAEVLGLDVGHGDPDPTRSELEHLFLQLCRRNGVPRPEVNVRVDAFVVDFLWPERRVIVEVDGYRYHRGRAAFEADRARDARLTELGFRVLRFTFRQLTSRRRQVTRALCAALRC